jgi:hypothetical protein
VSFASDHHGSLTLRGRLAPERMKGLKPLYEGSCSRSLIWRVPPSSLNHWMFNPHFSRPRRIRRSPLTAAVASQNLNLPLCMARGSAVLSVLDALTIEDDDHTKLIGALMDGKERLHLQIKVSCISPIWKFIGPFGHHSAFVLDTPTKLFPDW